MSDEAPTASGRSSEVPTQLYPRRQINPLALVLVVLVVGGLVFLLAQQWRLFSPDRVGSGHRVTLTHDGCWNGVGVSIEGATWKPTDTVWLTSWPTPPSGPVPPADAVSVSGTLRISSPDSGTFTADQGGAINMRRWPKGTFFEMGCSLQPPVGPRPTRP